MKRVIISSYQLIIQISLFIHSSLRVMLHNSDLKLLIIAPLALSIEPLTS